MVNLLKFKKKGLYFITTMIVLVSILSPIGFSLKNNFQNNYLKTNDNLFSFNFENLKLTLKKNVALAACYLDDKGQWLDENGNPCEVSNKSPNGLSEENTTLPKGIWCLHWTSINFPGCIAGVAYAVYPISASILHGVGSIFDALLSFSLSKNTIDQDFVKKTWVSLRDFANMLFILVLIAISISIILDLGKLKSKELIFRIIMIALLINFSLFISRVVIDAGNVIALGFYDAISVNDNSDISILGNSTAVKGIAGGLIKSFNPTKLFNPKEFGKYSDSQGTDFLSDQALSSVYALVYITAIGVTLYMAYLLFLAGIIFVVRIAWLWILMAVSPLAFIAFTIPEFKEHWNKWWKELFNKSFCIVVFLFLIWLTLTILGGGSFFEAPSSDTSLIALLAIIVLQAVIVFVLLRISLNETKKMCDDGDLGSKIVGLVSLVAGIAAVATKGGAGLFLRETLGRSASNRANEMVDSGKGTTAGGKLVLKTLRKVGNYHYGTKENYESHQEKGKQRHEDYMKSLDKEKNIMSKDKKGNPVLISAQEKYIENLRKQNLFQSLMNGPSDFVGKNRFVDEQQTISQERRNLLASNKKLADAKEAYEKHKDKVETGRMLDRPNARIFKRGNINKAQEELNKTKQENKKAEEKRKVKKESKKPEKKEKSEMKKFLEEVQKIITKKSK